MMVVDCLLNIGKEVIYVGDDEEILEAIKTSSKVLLGKQAKPNPNYFLVITDSVEIFVRAEFLRLAEVQRDFVKLDGLFPKKDLLGLAEGMR